MIEKIPNQIFKWLGKETSCAESPKKYADLRKYFPNDKYLNLKKIKKVLIIGGGTCKSEQKILNQFGITDIEITSCDFIKPKIYDRKLVKKLNWISKSISKKSKVPTKGKYDLIICLATSRYFEDPFKVLFNLKLLLNEKSLILFDFYYLPPIRRASVDFMYKWLIKEWAKNKNQTKKKLLSIAKISKHLGKHLSEKKINQEISIPELGIYSGERDIQSIVYESFFPFWSRTGASTKEISFLLAWQFLSISNDYDKNKISKFCDKKKLNIISLHEITNDTNLLICSN